MVSLPELPPRIPEREARADAEEAKGDDEWEWLVVVGKWKVGWWSTTALVCLQFTPLLSCDPLSNREGRPCQSLPESFSSVLDSIHGFSNFAPMVDAKNGIQSVSDGSAGVNNPRNCRDQAFPVITGSLVEVLVGTPRIFLAV